MRTGFLVGREKQLDATAIRKCGHRVNGLDDPALHVKDTRPGSATIGHGKRTRRQRTEGEHGVVVAEQEHLGFATTRPMHVRTGKRWDQPR